MVGMTIARNRMMLDCGIGDRPCVAERVGFSSVILHGPSITGCAIGINCGDRI